MTLAWTDIRDLPSGEFASLSESSISPSILEAEREVNESAFGDRYDDALKYLAAHLLAAMRQGSQGASGAVVSETVGPISRSYGAAAITSSDALESTSYGRRYVEIRRQCAGGPQVL